MPVADTLVAAVHRAPSLLLYHPPSLPILQYHVIPAGAVLSSELKDNQTFATALPSQTLL